MPQNGMRLQRLVHPASSVVVILLFILLVQCYNLDERTAVVRIGNPGTQFGFTVAQLIENNRRSFLVGAPKTQTAQPHVFRGGAVFKCPLDRLDCEIIPFDVQGNQGEWNGSSMVVVENKTMQWFGATLTASRSGDILACAPLYVYFSRTGSKREPVGACYLSQPGSKKFTRYSPCRKDRQLGHHRLGSCQSGFSAAFTTDSNHLILGAVGSFFWQGQIHSEDLREDNSLQSTDEGPSANDNTYMGYAVASGSFSTEHGLDFVVGTPKGNSLTGKISFLDSSMQPLYELHGEQIGEYFGSSIAVGDFNGDGLDDVAVGAPLYSSSAFLFDIGRVYVFHQTNQRDFRGVPPVRLGSSRRPLSRFGLAVVSLGDVDLDGHDDLAVGAPYDGPNGNGVVYVFQGSVEGIRSKESQVCYAEGVGSHLSAFGYSLSGGNDLDQNGYPDLLIGAFEADAAVLLRSRPVVRVKAEVRVEPEVIDLEDRSCRLPDETPVACFTVTFCASYSGLKVPSGLQFNLNWKLDSLKTHSLRTAFLEASSNSTTSVRMTAYKLLQECTSMLAYIKDKIRDKLSPIVVEVGYSLVESNLSSSEPQPVLDIYASHPAVAQGHILKNCGFDRVCIADLVVHVSSSKNYYVLGTDNEVELSVVVENNGEDAFEAIVRIEMPPGVVYINVNNMNSTDEVVCDSQRLENSTIDYVNCDIGNPLSANDQVAFSIRTSASRVSQINTDVLQFFILANSSNDENETSFGDNFVIFKIPVKAILNIKLTGASFPEQVLHNFTHVSEFLSEVDIGPSVTHLYEIRNFGPGVVGRMQTVIKWPSKTYDGSHLFYLLEEPRVILGRGRCRTDAANPLNLTLLPNNSDEMHHVYEYLKTDLDPTGFRTRRHVSSQSDAHLQQVTCGETMAGCTIIECETGPMSKDDSVLIRIRARVFFKTIVQMQTDYRGIFIRSEVKTSVVAVPYSVQPEVYITDVFRLETFVVALGVDQNRQPIEFWMIAVGIFVGCLLLFLIVIIMWRCGFFERQLQMALHQGQIKYETVKNECL